MFKKLNDLKKQLSEKWKNFKSRVLESNIFNLLREKYQSLDILQQKLIKYLSVFFIVAVLAYLPLSYFFSSSSQWKKFKERQAISLGLLKMRKKMSYSVLRYSQDQLKTKIEQIVERYTTSDFELKHKKNLFQKEGSIYQIDFDVQLRHLNVKQVVKLGTDLHNLSQARLSSIAMTKSEQFPKHYHVVYKLSAFVSTEKGKGISPRRRRKSPLYKDKKLDMGTRDSLLEGADDQLEIEDRLNRKSRKKRSIKKRKSRPDKVDKNIEGRDSQKDRDKTGRDVKKRKIQKDDESINLKKENQEEDLTINL